MHKTCIKKIGKFSIFIGFYHVWTYMDPAFLQRLGCAAGPPHYKEQREDKHKTTCNKSEAHVCGST